MSVLNRQQIEKRLGEGDLICNPRRKPDEQLDIEKDSYDLAAGTAIWKTLPTGSSGGHVKTLRYVAQPSSKPQPTVSVQPGQMIFVVTLEDLAMPQDVCGTVYSRNSLALSGVLALNAGHVDAGYRGPIVIRLINLRAIPWTLTLGDPIFTISFQKTKPIPDFDTSQDRRETQESMIRRVRETANAALSNALYELYSVNVDQRLNEFRSVDIIQRLHAFRTTALNEFTDIRDDRWVRKDQVWPLLMNTWWKKLLAIAVPILVTGSAIAAGVFAALAYFNAPPPP